MTVRSRLARLIRNTPKALLTSIIRIWEVITALLIALAAFLIVHEISEAPFISGEEIGAGDIVAKIHADTKASAVTAPFVVIDFKQADLHAWNYPALTPRDKLATVLRLAASGGPRLIVVDIDLGPRGFEKDDAALKDALTDLAKAKDVPILFVRQPLARSDEAEPATLQLTRFDDVMANSPNMHWVSALSMPDEDQVLRRYYLKTRTCPADSTMYLPGVQIASCAVLEHRYRNLQTALRKAPQCPKAERHLAATFTCAGHNWAIGDPDATAEIGFTIRHNPPEGKLRPQIAISGHHEPVDELEVLDAGPLLRHLADVDARDQFAGRIVVIGSSALSQGDIRRTPLGDMPGMYVIVNAIRSALEVGQKPRPTLWPSLTAVALMTLVTCLIWFGIRRIPIFGHIVFRDAAAPLMNVAWLVLVALVIPEVHSQEFVYPQIVVTLYLVVAFSVQELLEKRRAARLPKGDGP